MGTHNLQELTNKRPLFPVHNNQRDGHTRHTINTGRVSYEPNSLGGGCPFQAKASEGGFTSFPERIDARKTRVRSQSFFDHFSQAKLFFNSQSDAEKNHMVDALCFELGKVETAAIRERMVKLLTYVDMSLAAPVAVYLGIDIPAELERPLNGSFPADADPLTYQPIMVKSSLEKSAALSMANTIKDNIQTRRIAVLVAEGVDEQSVIAMKDALEAAGGVVDLVATKLGKIVSANNTEFPVMKSLLTTASVLYDAVYVPGGDNSVGTLATEPDALHFLNEAFKHCKAIAADAAALPVLQETYFARKLPEELSKESVMMTGLVIGDDINKVAELFINAIAQHRFWDREKPDKVPA